MYLPRVYFTSVLVKEAFIHPTVSMIVGATLAMKYIHASVNGNNNIDQS